MKCNTAWDNEFVLQAVNKTYYHSQLKDKKKDKMIEFEKGRIPATQEDAKRFLTKEKATKDIAGVQRENDELQVLINKNNQQIRQIRNKLREDLGQIVVEKKEFIMQCQVENCKGFLSTGYKCELCDTKTCPKCIEVIEGEHECKPDSIASAEMIKKDTKPCPKCSIRVYKIDGCNQMWCVNCNTPWDWISGKIVNGTIHNPHYYQFLQKQNAGVMPRNPGDMVCGGLPEIWAMNQILHGLDQAFLPIVRFIQINVFAIHRIIVDVRFRIIEERNQNRFEPQLTDSRIRYMLNRISEEEFRQEIYTINTKRDKVMANIRLLELIETVGTDLYQNYIKVFDRQITKDELFDESCKLIQQFVELIAYYEGQMDKKMRLFKQSGITFQIIGLSTPILITDKITVRNYGRI
jgi:hypothetical protein